MKYENIDIKKLQKFCKMINKLDWRKIEHTKIITIEMTCSDYLKYKDFYKDIISAKIQEGGTHNQEDANYLTQLITIQRKIDTRHKHKHIRHLLKRIFNIQDDDLSYSFYHNMLPSLSKRFAQKKHIADFYFFSFEIKTHELYDKVLKVVCVHFANSNFKLMLQINE